MKTKNTTTEKYLTFNPEGLTPYCIEFLASIEKRWLNNEVINRDVMYKEAVKHKGTPQAKEIIEAFEYWEFVPKPIFRNSLVTPILLNEFFTIGGTAYLWDTKKNNSWKVTESAKVLEVKKHLIGNLTTYYEITNDCLYIKYDQIIGGRYIANIINDLPIQDKK